MDSAGRLHVVYSGVTTRGAAPSLDARMMRPSTSYTRLAVSDCATAGLSQAPPSHRGAATASISASEEHQTFSPAQSFEVGESGTSSCVRSAQTTTISCGVENVH